MAITDTVDAAPSRGSRIRGLRILAASALSITFAIAFCAAVGWFMFGSPYALIAIARGRVLLVEPTILDAGTMKVGDSVELKFALTNLTSSPVLVHGIRSNCTCVSNDQAPLTLAPRERRILTLNAKPKATQAGQSYLQTVEIFPDIEKGRAVVKVKGQVLESSGVERSALD